MKVEGAALFRSLSLQDLILWANSPAPVGKSSYSYVVRYWHNREQIKDLASTLLSFQSNLWSIRIESSFVDIYTNDKSIYDSIADKFTDKIIHQFEPNENNQDLLENTNNIIVNKLPHNKYHYRVYLQPHKMAHDKDGKKKFINWLKQQNKLTCTPAIERWFINTDWNWDRRYILVEDEQTLLMLKLRNSEVVGKVYNFVVSDK